MVTKVVARPPTPPAGPTPMSMIPASTIIKGSRVSGIENRKHQEQLSFSVVRYAVKKDPPEQGQLKRIYNVKFDICQHLFCIKVSGSKTWGLNPGVLEGVGSSGGPVGITSTYPGI